MIKLYTIRNGKCIDCHGHTTVYHYTVNGAGLTWRAGCACNSLTGFSRDAPRPTAETIATLRRLELEAR